MVLTELLHQETILIDDAYLASLLIDIKEAKNSISLETYIFANDAGGQLVAEALCEAARRGVKVRVLVDGFGTQTWGNQLTRQLEEAGVQTRVFHPLPWVVWQWGRSAHTPHHFIDKLIYLSSKINSRDHRKISIFDNRIAYVGSANITMHILKNNDTWRETSVRLVDVNLTELQYAFEKAWLHLPLRKRILRYSFHYRESIFRLNDSWRRRRRFYKSLIWQLSSSQKRIWVTNSYFLPNTLLLKKLLQASKRGVDVRILLPHKSDVFISSLAAMTFYSILLKNGVLIYEYLPCMLHAKVLIIDDLYSVGSSNLNYRSLRHDLEVNVILSSSVAKRALDTQYLIDISQSRTIDWQSLKKQKWYQKLIGRLILFGRYWI
jgi:cardiolipin synthase